MEHNISAYLASDGNKYLPVLECSCGFCTGHCDTWEEAGAEFDGHVSAIKKDAQ